MVIEDMIEDAMNVFKEKLTHFCKEESEGALSVESAHMITQGLQHALAAAGRAAFATYLESKESMQDVVVAGGELFRFKYSSEKRFETLWGLAGIRRRVYQNASDTKTHVPLDAAWGMADQFMMIEVREAVAFSCALVTPEETYALLGKSALFHPHPTQIKRCVEEIGAQVAVDPLGLDARIRAQEQAPEGARVLAASLDGVNVLLNEPAERGGKRGRPAERPGAGEGQASSTAYRNAMVGSMTFYGAVPQGDKTPQRLACRYTSHMPEDHAVTFKTKFEAELAEAERKAPPGITKVLLCDGARAIWNYAEHNERYNDYEKLIDYCHALEHLSLAAEALFGKNSNQGRAWYDKYRKKLLEEDLGARSVLHSIEYYEQTSAFSKSRREALEAQRTFFRRNQARMSYVNFRRRGLPIGSGPVEAACKTLVKTRLCRSGMRWSRKGGQRILDLRTYVKSNRWDTFWHEYKKLLLTA
jgi:hypothetical protein